MEYGHFDEQNREYVITRPDTPAPWCNYLGSAHYRAIVSNTGGGFSYDGDASLKRVLRDRPRSLPEDRPGRYFYLRDRDTGRYWSPTWQPVTADLQQYECRHGLGYTTIRSARDGIAAEVTYLVPIGEHLELWMLTVRNEDSQSRTLDVFTYAEFCLWGMLKDLLNLQASKYVGIVRSEDGVILHETRSDSGPPRGTRCLCSIAPTSDAARRRRATTSSAPSSSAPIGMRAIPSPSSAVGAPTGSTSDMTRWRAFTSP